MDNYRNMQRSNSPRARSTIAFALYEVLMGLAIFALGVLALGRAVQNCLQASTLNAEENRVRQILSNRMAEVQATPGPPDQSKEFNVDTGYGTVRLIQRTAPADLQDDLGAQLSSMHHVTLTAKWARGGVDQSQQIEFYVYRPG
jgi:Tfp pilus assembly protein PilV